MKCRAQDFHLLDNDDLRPEMAHTSGEITINQVNEIALLLYIINYSYIN